MGPFLFRLDDCITTLCHTEPAYRQAGEAKYLWFGIEFLRCAQDDKKG
jgi:hypothetical protein